MDNVCQHHDGFTKMIEKLSEEIKRLSESIDEIKLALLGDYQKSGWLTMTKEKMTELEGRLKQLEEWKTTINKGIQWSLAKIIGALLAAVASGGLIVTFFEKLFK